MCEEMDTGTMARELKETVIEFLDGRLHIGEEPGHYTL